MSIETGTSRSSPILCNSTAIALARQMTKALTGLFLLASASCLALCALEDVTPRDDVVETEG